MADEDVVVVEETTDSAEGDPSFSTLGAPGISPPGMKAQKVKRTEYLPPLLVGAWVRLADTELVDPRVVGHVARVTDAPVVWVDSDEHSPRPHQHQGEGTFTVETRDQYNIVISGLTRDDFTEFNQDGRHTIVQHG